MNEDHALAIGLVVFGAALVISQLVESGPFGAGATIGMCMVLLGIRGFTTQPQVAAARVVRSR